jgi:Putative Ig domain
MGGDYDLTRRNRTPATIEQDTQETMSRIFFAAGLLALLAAEPATAQVGTTLRVITVPVTSSSCCGIGIAVDCNGDLYYTNSFDPTLYQIDAFGNLLNTTPITDSATGGPVTVGAISWDNNRMMLWGGTDSSGSPVSAYLIDPGTGSATFQFLAVDAGFGFTDGIAYDASDDSVWISDDVSTLISHQDATTGADLGSLAPLDSIGNPLTDVSGVSRGTGNILYLGQDGLGQIVQVDKNTGAFISTFASPGGRDEDLECDPINFGGTLALWSKDAYNNQITAIEVEPGTCACGGAANNPPLFVAPSPCDQTLSLSVGAPFSYTVSVLDVDPNDTVTLNASGVPAGATHAPGLPASGNPVSTTFSWTPTNAQVGVYNIVYTATDSSSPPRSTTCTVTLVVAECHMLFATAAGSQPFSYGGYTWTTQLDGIYDHYGVTMENIPSFVLPDPGPGVRHGFRAHGTVLRARNDFVVPVNQYTVQVLLWNPEVFPWHPERHTGGLDVTVWSDGHVDAVPFGTASGMQLHSQVYTGADGLRRVRFPFTIDGF